MIAWHQNFLVTGGDRGRTAYSGYSQFSFRNSHRELWEHRSFLAHIAWGNQGAGVYNLDTALTTGMRKHHPPRIMREE